MDKKTTIKDRILTFIEREGIKKGDFFAETGMSESNFKGKNLQSQLGGDALVKILTRYPRISPHWLLLGEGDMLRASTPSYVIHDTITQPHSLPFFDVEFSGGFEATFNDQTTTPDGYISIPGFDKAECWCRLRGNSMHPEIKNGDLIALRPCDISQIIYGHIYAVVMEDYRTVKRIRKAKRDNYLRFIPINTEEYDEQEFHKKDIIRIFEVVGNLRKQS